VQIGLHLWYGKPGNFSDFVVTALLKQAGYATALVGKKHVKPDNLLPYDDWLAPEQSGNRDVGFMAREADAALLEWNPLVWMAIRRRGLFVMEDPETLRSREPTLPHRGRRERLWGPLRRNFFDRFGRR